MRSFKKEFYSAMKSEVTKFANRETDKLPFFCMYMKAKNEEAVSGISLNDVKKKQRNDKYIQLLTEQKRLKAGKISRAEYFRELLLIVTDKRHNDDKEVYDICLSIYEKVMNSEEKKSLSENKSVHAEHKNKLKAMLKNLEETEVPEESFDIFLLETLTEKVLNDILIQTAKERLYDIEKGRKSDDTMNMLDMFFKVRGNFSLSHEDFSGDRDSSRRIDKEDFEDIQNLFEMMRSDPQMIGAAVPLAFDIKSGTGIYILGRKYIPVKKKDFAAYCIITQSDFEATISDCIECFDDKFFEANLTYESYINNLENSSYKVFNPEPPSDCPKIFLDYFEYDEEEYKERERLRLEMIESEKAELQRRKQNPHPRHLQNEMK